jgi:hypothetical protein
VGASSASAAAAWLSRTGRVGRFRYHDHVRIAQQPRQRDCADETPTWSRWRRAFDCQEAFPARWRVRHQRHLSRPVSTAIAPIRCRARPGIEHLVRGAMFRIGQLLQLLQVLAVK